MRFAPMMRSIDLVLLAVLVGVVVWTFQVKQESQEAIDRVVRLEQQIAAKEIEIDLLKSDWSLLTSPARLQRLVERHQKELELEQAEAIQIADETQLPVIPSPDFSVTEDDPDFAEVDAGVNTGSIGGNGSSQREDRQ